MAKINLPYDIINGDAVDAGPVQSNYTTIERHANQELIERGGTVAMVAQLKLVGNPVAALDAAPKQYVDQMLPIGIITMFGGAVAPVGGVWLLCDGHEYQVTDYPALAAILANAAGGLFKVPDLKDKFAVGSGGAYANLTSGGSKDAAIVDHLHKINHTHPATFTGNDTTHHTHTLPTHTHGSTGLIIAADGVHWHQLSNAGTFVGGGPSTGSAPQGFIRDALITPGAGAYSEFGGTGDAGSHAHGISGSTAGSGALVTGGVDQNHVHTTPALDYLGFTVSTESGVPVTDKNLPPYTAVSYIIRAA